MEFVLFHYTIPLFSPNITRHDIPWSGLCLLFPHCLLQHFQANSHLIFPTESPNTLPTHALEKMRPERSSGESFKAGQRSLLQKQILFSLPTQTWLIKSMSDASGMTAFSLGILFFTYQMRFPYQPPNHNIPNQILALLHEGKLGTDGKWGREPHWIDTSICKSWWVWVFFCVQGEGGGVKQ